MTELKRRLPGTCPEGAAPKGCCSGGGSAAGRLRIRIGSPAAGPAAKSEQCRVHDLRFPSDEAESVDRDVVFLAGRDQVMAVDEVRCRGRFAHVHELSYVRQHLSETS